MNPNSELVPSLAARKSPEKFVIITLSTFSDTPRSLISLYQLFNFMSDHHINQFVFQRSSTIRYDTSPLQDVHCEESWHSTFWRSTTEDDTEDDVNR